MKHKKLGILTIIGITTTFCASCYALSFFISPQESIVNPTKTPHVVKFEVIQTQPSSEVVIPEASTPMSTDIPTSTSIPREIPTASNSACECGFDTYNCEDFGSHEEAQTCFEYCLSVGVGDIHKLDRDKDDLVCEND